MNPGDSPASVFPKTRGLHVLTTLTACCRTLGLHVSITVQVSVWALGILISAEKKLYH